MPKFFNVHTHHIEKETVGILNHFIQDEIRFPKNQLISAGLHPWHLEQVNIMDCMDKLKSIISSLDAVGECGLDRFIKIPIEKQKEVFIQQIDIAEEAKKPMIIHCVKAYADILQIRKALNCKSPWIIHGFMGNLPIAQQLINKGCFLSFGKSILQNRPKLEQVLKETDSKFHFFETDDETNLLIEEVYKKGALVYKDDIKSVIQEKIEIAKNIFFKTNHLF